MFTGIIENTGIIIKASAIGGNIEYWIKSSLSTELDVDQSLSHNGVCLTVEEVNSDTYKVTAIQETLSKTNMSTWKAGDIINLERCMKLNGRLDGHIVQGHIDTTAECKNIQNLNGSWEFTFQVDKKFASLIIEKGSIALNGISLTIFNVTNNSFTVGIIPYTYENTTMKQLKAGDVANIEFDMIGKYVSRIALLNKDLL